VYNDALLTRPPGIACKIPIELGSSESSEPPVTITWKVKKNVGFAIAAKVADGFRHEEQPEGTGPANGRSAPWEG
jgi:hypothetical protein